MGIRSGRCPGEVRPLPAYEGSLADSMEAKSSAARGPLRRECLRAAWGLVFQAAVLFGVAGRVDWGLAWAYLGLVAGLSLGQLWILRRDPGLAAERAAGFSKGPGWDRALVVAMTLPGTLGVWILAGLQQRFGWTPAPPLWISVAALPVAFSGYGLLLWALRSNTFFAPVVRLQRDRGQTVVSTGPTAWSATPAISAGWSSRWRCRWSSAPTGPWSSPRSRWARRSCGPTSRTGCCGATSRATRATRATPDVSLGVCCRGFGESAAPSLVAAAPTPPQYSLRPFSSLEGER